MKSENKHLECIIPVRYTIEELKRLEAAANALDMPVSTYIRDKSLNGKERNRYTKKQICKTIVQVENLIAGVIYDVKEKDSETIEVNKIIPKLEQAKEVCDKLCKF